MYKSTSIQSLIIVSAAQHSKLRKRQGKASGSYCSEKKEVKRKEYSHTAAGSSSINEGIGKHLAHIMNNASYHAQGLPNSITAVDLQNDPHNIEQEQSSAEQIKERVI